MGWDIEKAVRVAREAALEGLYAGAEAILTDAINNTPKDTGTLRRSGTVTIGGRGDIGAIYAAALAGRGMNKEYKHKVGAEAVVYISFNTPYAALVHEGYPGHTITAKGKKVLATTLTKYKNWLKNAGLDVGNVLSFLEDNRHTGKLPCLSANGKYVIFGRAVSHPGYQGAKYLEKAFNANKEKVLAYAEQKMRKALREAH